MCEIKGESLNPLSTSSTRIEIETDEKSSKKNSTCIESDFSSCEKFPELVISSKESNQKTTSKRHLIKLNCSNKKVSVVVLVIMALASVSFVLITIAVLWSNLFDVSESAEESFFKTDWRESRMLESGHKGTNPEPQASDYYYNNYDNEKEKDIDKEYLPPMYLCRENSTNCLIIMRNDNNDNNNDHGHHHESSDLFPSARDLPEEIELEDSRDIQETRETPDSFIPDFSEENQRLRLRNGTVLSMKPLKKNLRFRLSPTLLNHDYSTDSSSSSSDEESSQTTTSVNYDSGSSEKLSSNILTKKLLALHTPTTNTNTNTLTRNTDKNKRNKKKNKESLKKGETENIENISNKSRIIAYTIRPSSTNITTTSSSGSLSTYPTITLASLARQLIFPNWFWSRAGVAASTKATSASSGSAATTTSTASTTTRISNRTGLSYATKGLQPITQLPSISFDNNLSRFLKLFTLVRFENTACSTAVGQNGTCYNSRECSDLGGVAAGKCANGFGVCCVFQVLCNGVSSRNGTYFVDTGVNFQANQVQTCSVTILKTTPFIKQMRVDFLSFSLRQPVAGSCEIDRFIVSGQNTNNIIPILCGQNTGSHIYVETTGSSNGIQLSIMTTGEGSRTWMMRITQYATTDNGVTPSPNCLQYHTGVMGMIQSFNYISTTSPQYLNNLNYAVCIRREAGFCSVTYSNAGPDGTYQPFQIVNANAEGSLVIPSGQAGVGVRDCPYDFININGIRLCGERLNDATTSLITVQDAPVTDFSNGPFIVNVRTNEIDVGGGFNIYYRQNPCMSTPG